MDSALLAPLPPLSEGDLAPAFRLPIASGSPFTFDAAAGRYVLLGFLPPPGPARAAALAAFQPHLQRFDDRFAAAFLVVRDAESIATVKDLAPRYRWFLDAEGTVSRLYGALDEAGREEAFWLLLDPTLRVLVRAPMDRPEPVFQALEALPPVEAHAGTPLTAPVLIVPRVFEPDMCRRLIAYYDAQGGQVSGVMREVGGRTVGVVDDFKRRRDVTVPLEDTGFRAELRARLVRRLLPQIKTAYQFAATRVERYLVACYDAEEGGYFRPHRDNTTKGTAHRRFAVSINLNAEAFEGGDLRFPEFGQKTYRPPTGGAVVFCCSLLHEATAVTRGRRYAFLPFLYDDEGERIRQANMQFLDAGQPA
jgi:predicted 2-oxoglutarate/Fe(II)-dependent dioxygenase YbiX/peroxiredoxin